jgi:hypothetical protein
VDVSKPKATLHLGGEVRRVSMPEGGEDRATAEGACPHCGATPFVVSGCGVTSKGHDTYYADARTRCCERPAGQLQLKVNTLFGIEEDERVLRGRCRVY